MSRNPRAHGAAPISRALVSSAVLAAGIAAVAPATAAHAEDVVPDFQDESIAFTWGTPTLTADANNDGTPDPGDTVRYAFTLSPVAGEFTHDAAIGIGGDLMPVGDGAVWGDFTTDVTVTAEMLDDHESGPSLSTFELSYLAPGGTSTRVDLPDAPLLFDAPAWFEGMFIEVQDAAGNPVEGTPSEGDRVRYVSDITVAQPADIGFSLLTRSGDRGGSLSKWGLTDTGWRMASSWTTVTTADMIEGSFQMASKRLAWFNFRQGKPLGAEDYEPVVEMQPLDISASDLDLDVIVVDSAGLPKPAQSAAVGDDILAAVVFGNDGNVSINEAAVALTGTNGPSSIAASDLAVTPGTPADAASPVIDPVAIHTVTAEDIDRGYLQIGANVSVGPDGDHLREHSLPRVVAFQDLTPTVTVAAEATLVDSNGDGIGQPGEKVEIVTTVINESSLDLPVTIAGVSEPDDIDGAADDLIGQPVATGATAQVTHMVTLGAEAGTAGDLAYSLTVEYTGDVDGSSGAASGASARIRVGPYVAPPTTLDLDASYDDTNGDGAPSIGETAAFVATVANEGGHPLTGLSLTQSGSAAGILPADATVAPGATVTWTVEHVLTAADFARGGVMYAVTAEADGLTTLSRDASIEGIAFDAFESDLDGVPAGGIALCTPSGDALVSAVPGTPFIVKVATCDGAMLGDSDRVYVFSEPVALGAGPVALAVPSDLPVGDHRVAAYGADGVLLGWAPLDVVAPVVEDPAPTAAPADEPDADIKVLSASGTDPHTASVAWAASALILLGCGALVASRRFAVVRSQG